MHPDVENSMNNAHPANGQAKAFSGINSKSPGAKNLLAQVYRLLDAHQQAERGWVFHGLAVFAHEWWDRFNHAFALAIPKTALRLEWNVRHNCLGYFRERHNEFGVTKEIALAVAPHLSDVSAVLVWLNTAVKEQAQPSFPLEYANRGELLGTLLHEQLHLHQQILFEKDPSKAPGAGNYHNKAFRTKAGELGLVVTPQGYQGYLPDGSFQRLLLANGIEPPLALALGATPLKKFAVQGTCKQKLWQCGCQRPFNVRVARGDFRAKCLYCDREFSRVG